ncbi:hypothetical protein L204_104772 [Cryptococcus depauperatus]|nr:COP9 signalosome complex subunit 4 [Cryptococcus depauperatus CBS 7855]
MSLQEQLHSATLIASQPQRTAAYLDILQTLLTAPPVDSQSLVQFANHFIATSNVTIVVGHRVLGAYVTALVAGSSLEQKGTAKIPLDEEGEMEKSKWESLGEQAFKNELGETIRRDVVQAVLDVNPSGWCEEQITVLRHLHSHLLTLEEDYEAAARALAAIPLESSSRQISDTDKQAVYMSITRLALECSEWGLAQTYFTRASLLPRPVDKEMRLAMRLSQAKLFDFSGQFAKAAAVYHDLSHDTMIDPTDRLTILSAASTCALLSPPGPYRSRLLANLNRDDRVHTELPASLSTILRKMLLEYIVKPGEVREFERGLAQHQRATVEGGGTVVERVVREHNVEACGKVYDNISFEALGAVLGLSAEDAEETARRMIEQSRLRAYIDQPTSLLFFEPSFSHHNAIPSDADALGQAGGLGIEREEKEIEKGSWRQRWDERVRGVSVRVEELAENILSKGLVAV